MVFKKVSVLTQDTSRISCAPDIIKNSPKKGPSLLGQYNWIMYFFKQREREKNSLQILQAFPWV